MIGLIHRQETIAFLGFPVARYIDIDDSEAVLRAIQLTDTDVPIDMIATGMRMSRTISISRSE